MKIFRTEHCDFTEKSNAVLKIDKRNNRDWKWTKILRTDSVLHGISVQNDKYKSMIMVGVMWNGSSKIQFGTFLSEAVEASLCNFFDF